MSFAARVLIRLRGFFFLTLVVHPLFAQPDTLSSYQIGEVVMTLASAIEEGYVDEQQALRMANSLRTKLKYGSYFNFHDAAGLANQLEADLQHVQSDFHLRVYAGANNLDRYADSSDAWTFFNHDRLSNFGLKRTDHFPGNVGYIMLDEFTEWLDARKALSGAMATVQFSDALIIDLRFNTGGAPETMHWFLSHFFDGKSKTEFTGLFFREEGKTNRVFVEKKLDAPRYLDKPVYVLTGPYTASAAESFAWDMKRLGRGLIVGETTRGGAQPARTYMLPHGFRVLLPIGKAVTPGSGLNWEGTGVAPNVEVRQEAALEYGLALALDSLKTLSAKQDMRSWYDHLAYRRAILAHQYSLPADSLGGYEGNYEGRKVTAVNGQLFYQNTGKTSAATRLLALPEGGFVFDSEETHLNKQTKVFFIEETGEITGLKLVFESGNERVLKRD
ncbi:MAG: S41 family peptidase [Bacteroidia bacterium]